MAGYPSDTNRQYYVYDYSVGLIKLEARWEVKRGTLTILNKLMVFDITLVPKIHKLMILQCYVTEKEIIFVSYIFVVRYFIHSRTGHTFSL